VAFQHAPFGRSRTVRLGEDLDQWLKSYAARRPGNTVVRYRYGISKLRQLPVWRARLADLDRLAIAAAYDSIEPRTVSHVHDGLHRALVEAVDDGFIMRNPASGAMRGRHLPTHEIAAWNESEYRSWLDVVRGEDLYPLWLLLGQTGARRGEALGLDWPDVDLERGVITIRQQYTPVAGRLMLKDVKTSRGRRSVDIDPHTVEVLAALRHERPNRATLLGRDAYAVFAQGSGARLSPSKSLDERFHASIARAGVRKITIHGLRHTHATLLLRRGVPTHVVSKRLGHASEGFTLQQYAHVLPDMSRSAANIAFAITGSHQITRAGEDNL